MTMTELVTVKSAVVELRWILYLMVKLFELTDTVRKR